LSAGEDIEQVVADIWTLAEPVIRVEGMELIEVEYRRESHGWVLRLYIDQEGGISVDDCAKVSQVVGDVLDVADLIKISYHLEVSSPGLDRPLRRKEHFEKYVGKIVEVLTSEPMEGRRRFKCILEAVLPAHIVLGCNGSRWEIPFSNLERAKLCYFESLKE
jgi:ribosome maturation factor RimP